MYTKKGYAFILLYETMTFILSITIFPFFFFLHPTYVPGIMPWKNDSVTQYLH